MTGSMNKFNTAVSRVDGQFEYNTYIYLILVDELASICYLIYHIPSYVFSCQDWIVLLEAGLFNIITHLYFRF